MIRAENQNNNYKQHKEHLLGLRNGNYTFIAKKAGNIQWQTLLIYLL